jgi:hypothetical protein
MTAQVAILNKMGVALASDSALTVGGKKVFNTTNKVFTLSKYQPVGVMVYGNANYMGVPYETVIKTFREGLGNKGFPTVNGYVAAFKRYLASRTFKNAEMQRRNALSVAVSMFMALDNGFVKELAREKGVPVEKLDPKDVQNVVRKRTEWMRAQKTADGLRSIRVVALQRRYRSEIKAAREYICKWPLWRRAERDLDRYCAVAMRASYFASSRSGILIAGYGTGQYFPEYVNLHTEGVLAGKLKLRTSNKGRITHTNGAIIVPLAQTDMVHLFMYGVDREYQAFLERSVPEFIGKVGSSIVDAYVIGPKKKIDKIKAGLVKTKAIQKILDSFWASAKDYRNKSVTRDIIQVVESLPKADLAGLAEALVNLTTTKRQVTPQQETVGGPVDVAVISKGDGFIWIKRKHYFDPQLNQHFLDRYFRD